MSLSNQSVVLTVRHGESMSNQVIHESKHQQVDEAGVRKLESFDDPSLTEKGQAQATQTAEYIYKQLLSTYGSDVKVEVWISPFLRTRQTAQLFLDIGASIIQNIKNE